MGRAIIGGVITSTLLTLVVVPVLYCYLVRARKRPASERRRLGLARAGRCRRVHAGVEGLTPVARPPRRLLRDLDHVAHHRVDLVLPAPAAEHAVVADVRLHVVGAQVGRRPRQRSCAASVWPIAQMSSRSPSTVSSAVRRIAAGSILRPRKRQLAERQRVLLEHQAHRLEVEVGRQVGDRACTPRRSRVIASPRRPRRRRGARSTCGMRRRGARCSCS